MSHQRNCRRISLFSIVLERALSVPHVRQPRVVLMDDFFRRSHDSGLFHAARSWLLERRIMLRNSTRDLRSAQIGSLVFAALFVAAFAAPTYASGVTNLSEEPPPAEHQFSVPVTPKDPSEETIRVPVWIPGFDDVEPSFTCLPMAMPNLSVKQSSSAARYLVGFAAGMRRFGQLSVVDSCRGILRTLPWNSPSAPIGPIQVLLPMV